LNSLEWIKDLGELKTRLEIENQRKIVRESNGKGKGLNHDNKYNTTPSNFHPQIDEY